MAEQRGGTDVLRRLEDLEVAAHDGRLARLGVGPKRLAGIRESLAQRLGRVRGSAAPDEAPPPPVSELLDVDAEYRSKAAAGALPRIEPRRFNPGHERWLPILHTQRGHRHYTALFSNTPRAHRLAKTRDWVVLYVDGAPRAPLYRPHRTTWPPGRTTRGGRPRVGVRSRRIDGVTP